MVAEEAGVSLSTVSRMLNGTSQVSQDKTLEIKKAIAKLGFRPNHIAQSLVKGKTMTVGVLTQYIDSPFFGEILRGVEDVLSKSRYLPLFASGQWALDEQLNQIDFLLERGIDGLIILGGELDKKTIISHTHNTPVVLVGRYFQSHGFAGIDYDDYYGLSQAVYHLYELGHRSIAFISGPQDRSDAINRLLGFRSKMRELDLNVDEELIVEGGFTEQTGYVAMTRLLETGKSFSALIASNDQMAYGARLALDEANVKVPEDISLVGFDDLPHSQYTIPPLTTIRLPIFHYGQRSAETIIAFMKGEKPLLNKMSAKLVVRQSTAQHT